MQKHLLAVAAGTVVAGGLVGSVAAAPSNAPSSEEFELICDNEATYTVVVNGNGEWTPGHAEDGVVLIPTAFPSFVGVYTDPDGNAFPFEEPPVSKNDGRAGNQKDLISCTFEVSFSDPDTGESFEATGTVEGFLVGKPGR